MWPRAHPAVEGRWECLFTPNLCHTSPPNLYVVKRNAARDLAQRSVASDAARSSSSWVFPNTSVFSVSVRLSVVRATPSRPLRAHGVQLFQTGFTAIRPNIRPRAVKFVLGQVCVSFISESGAINIRARISRSSFDARSSIASAKDDSFSKAFDGER